MPEFKPENILPVSPSVVSVTILPTFFWIEDDFLGNKHVMVQHQGQEPFTYATLYYNYMYTSNATIRIAANNLAVSIGATEPVEYRTRPIKFPENLQKPKD